MDTLFRCPRRIAWFVGAAAAAMLGAAAVGAHLALGAWRSAMLVVAVALGG